MKNLISVVLFLIPTLMLSQTVDVKFYVGDDHMDMYDTTTPIGDGLEVEALVDGAFDIDISTDDDFTIFINDDVYLEESVTVTFVFTGFRVVNPFIDENTTPGEVTLESGSILSFTLAPDLDVSTGEIITIGYTLIPTTDGDMDGILDGNDLCPDTPSGVTVDADGCAIVEIPDADSDGVADADDTCPNSGPDAVVNAQGCTDEDGDGHFPDGSGDEFDPDDDDKCTPVAIDATCLDSDQDGVNNAIDQCPNTEPGASVNTEGCTDEDGDGFYPDVDFGMEGYDGDDDNFCFPDATPDSCQDDEEEEGTGTGIMIDPETGEPIPTMGQWSLFILTLLTSCVAVAHLLPAAHRLSPNA